MVVKCNVRSYEKHVFIIVIKPNSGIDGVDLTKKSGPETQIDLGQSKKIKKKMFEVLISHMKKLRNNSCKYKLYML
jgi:hypothetical protein